MPIRSTCKSSALAWQLGSESSSGSSAGPPAGMSIDPNTGPSAGRRRWPSSGSKRSCLTWPIPRGSAISRPSACKVTLNVAPPQITSTPPTTGVVGQLYLYQVAVTAGITSVEPTGGLIYMLTTAPAGMTIDSNTGAIQWTPADYGKFPVTIEVEDILGQSVQQSYSINVALAPLLRRR